MTTLDKVRWALGLGVVFLMVIITGRSNVPNSKKIQEAIETLYEDRLVVKGHIFDLQSILHAKELAVARRDEDYFAQRSAAANDKALGLLAEFRDTYLVPKEKSTLERFTSTFTALTKTEAELGADGRLEGEGGERLSKQLDSLKADLAVLARIQLDEGRRQMVVGDAAMEKIDLVDKIETYMLAVLGALAIVIVLVIPRRMSA